MAAEGGDGVVEQAAGHLLVVHREERQHVMMRVAPLFNNKIAVTVRTTQLKRSWLIFCVAAYRSRHSGRCARPSLSKISLKYAKICPKYGQISLNFCQNVPSVSSPVVSGHSVLQRVAAHCCGFGISRTCPSKKMSASRRSKNEKIADDCASVAKPGKLNRISVELMSN